MRYICIIAYKVVPQVGLSDQNLAINAFDSLASGIEVRFSLYGLREDMAEVLDLISKV